MKDPRLASLIMEGDELLRRMDRIDSIDISEPLHEKLHLREMQQWAEDAEEWASLTGAAIPERGNRLTFVLGWEDPAYAYVRRLTDALKRYTDEHVGVIQPSPLPSKGHVFVSYIHEDSEMVQQLCDDLKSYGAHIWLDRNAINPGVRWKQAVRRAVQQGTFFIACFSQAFCERDRTYMYEELNLAIEELRQRPNDRSWFIPVKLSKCDIPDLDIGPGATLRDIQFVELYLDWNAGICRIIDVIAPLPRQLSVWIDLLNSANIDDRVSAAEALYEKPDPRAMKSLLRALDNRSANVEYWAAKALGRIGDPAAVPSLICALKRRTVNGYKIAEVLKGFHTEEAQQTVEAYRKVKNDPWAFIMWAEHGMDPDEALEKSPWLLRKRG